MPDFDQCPSNHAEILYQEGENQGAVGLPGCHKACCKFAIKTKPIGACTGAKHPLNAGHCQRKWQSRWLEQQESWHTAHFMGFRAAFKIVPTTADRKMLPC